MRVCIYIYSGIKFLKSIDFKYDLLSFTQYVSCLHFPSACIFLFLYKLEREEAACKITFIIIIWLLSDVERNDET